MKRCNSVVAGQKTQRQNNVVHRYCLRHHHHSAIAEEERVRNSVKHAGVPNRHQQVVAAEEAAYTHTDVVAGRDDNTTIAVAVVEVVACYERRYCLRQSTPRYLYEWRVVGHNPNPALEAVHKPVICGSVIARSPQRSCQRPHRQRCCVCDPPSADDKAEELSVQIATKNFLRHVCPNWKTDA